jgi:hypothetical protein
LGTEIIDGIEVDFEAHTGGEAADELVIKLPAQGVLVAQISSTTASTCTWATRHRRLAEARASTAARS